MREKIGRDEPLDVSKIIDEVHKKIKERDTNRAIQLSVEAVQAYLDRIEKEIFPMTNSSRPYAYAALKIHMEQIENMFDDNCKEVAENLHCLYRLSTCLDEIHPNGKEDVTK